MATRNTSLDALKLIMAFMVIGIHTHFLSDISQTLNYLLENGLFRIAVPVFMIISGFYTFNHFKTPTQATNSRFKRFFILYFIWTLFYSLFWFKSLQGAPNFIWILFNNVIIGYHHLWYLSSLICALYVLYFFRQSSSTFLVVSAATTFFIGVTLQYISYYHLFFDTGLEYWMYRNFIFFSYPFLCVGYLISKHELHTKLSLRQAKFLVMVGLFGLLFESYFHHTHKLLSSSDGFDILFFLALLSPSIFIFVIKHNIASNSNHIALLATAVYLIHPSAQWLLSFIFVNQQTSLIEASLLTFAVAFFSILFACLLLKLNRTIKYLL